MIPYLSVDDLIAIRNRLTDRPGVEEQIDYTAVDQIDAQLAQVAPGIDNRVDQALGRPEAIPTPRPGYFASASVTIESVKPLADEMIEQYGAAMHDSPRDWQDLRGDLDI